MYIKDERGKKERRSNRIDRERTACWVYIFCIFSYISSSFREVFNCGQKRNFISYNIVDIDLKKKVNTYGSFIHFDKHVCVWKKMLSKAFNKINFKHKKVPWFDLKNNIFLIIPFVLWNFNLYYSLKTSFT